MRYVQAFDSQHLCLHAVSNVTDIIGRVRVTQNPLKTLNPKMGPVSSKHIVPFIVDDGASNNDRIVLSSPHTMVPERV